MLSERVVYLFMSARESNDKALERGSCPVGHIQQGLGFPKQPITNDIAQQNQSPSQTSCEAKFGKYPSWIWGKARCETWQADELQWAFHVCMSRSIGLVSLRGVRVAASIHNSRRTSRQPVLTKYELVYSFLQEVYMTLTVVQIWAFSHFRTSLEMLWVLWVTEMKNPFSYRYHQT